MRTVFMGVSAMILLFLAGAEVWTARTQVAKALASQPPVTFTAVAPIDAVQDGTVQNVGDGFATDTRPEVQVKRVETPPESTFSNDAVPAEPLGVANPPTGPIIISANESALPEPRVQTEMDKFALEEFKEGAAELNFAPQQIDKPESEPVTLALMVPQDTGLPSENAPTALDRQTAPESPAVAPAPTYLPKTLYGIVERDFKQEIAKEAKAQIEEERRSAFLFNTPAQQGSGPLTPGQQGRAKTDQGTRQNPVGAEPIKPQVQTALLQPQPAPVSSPPVGDVQSTGQTVPRAKETSVDSSPQSDSLPQSPRAAVRAVPKTAEPRAPKASAKTKKKRVVKRKRLVKKPRKSAKASKPAKPVAALNRTERAGFARRVAKCYRAPAGVAGSGVKLRMRVALTPDGFLKSSPRILSGATSRTGNLVYNAARRALIRCQPFKLPANKYAAWRTLTVTVTDASIGAR